MAYPPVVVVDEQDNVIGAAPLADAWANGFIHRLAFVIVEDSEGRILLQKRALTMQLYPGCWDSAGGHVDVTPSYLETAKLELKEEVGIEGVELVKLAKVYTEDPYDNGVRAKRFITIFKTHFDGEPGPLAEDEATETRWFTKAEIATLAADQPELVSEVLYRCLPFILSKEARPRRVARSLATTAV